MKKRFNWLGLLIIVIYAGVFVFCIVKAIIGDPDTWVSIALFWGVLGGLLAYFGWSYSQQHSLKETKEHAVLISRTTKTEQHWRNGHSVTDSIPVLVFALQDGRHMAFESKSRLALKLYNVLRCGDSGTLTFKKGKKHIYFIDFVRD